MLSEQLIEITGMDAITLQRRRARMASSPAS